MAEESADAHAEEQISYEEWGAAFFETAVTSERLTGAVAALAGQPIDFGPIGVGPGRIARVAAKGRIGDAELERLTAGPSEPISYRLVVPVTLDFEVGLPDGTHRFHADLEVPLLLTARALSGLRIYIDIAPPRGRDVTATVRAEGLRASLMQRIANVEGELCRFVAKYVAREVEKPQIAQARIIDVAGAIDKAWASLAPRGSGSRVTDDFNSALESEIREHEGEYLD